MAVAGLATFLIGGLWYTAMFGKLWQRLHGYNEEKMKEMHARRPPPIFFGGMIGGYLIIALSVALLLRAFKVESAIDGATVGLLLWVGPAAAIQLTGWLASDKPIGVYLIDISYQLIYLVMMGAILGGWR